MQRIDGKKRNLEMFASVFQNNEATEAYIKVVSKKWREVGPCLGPYMKVDQFVDINWILDIAEDKRAAAAAQRARKNAKRLAQKNRDRKS